jgi:cytochrome c556
MNSTTAKDATPEKVAEYEATIHQYLTGMEQMQKEIAGNRREIDRLRAETEVMLKNTLNLLKVT